MIVEGTSLESQREEGFQELVVNGQLSVLVVSWDGQWHLGVNFVSYGSMK